MGGSEAVKPQADKWPEHPSLGNDQVPFRLTVYVLLFDS